MTPFLALAAALLLADAPPAVPLREEVARSFQCPPGAQRMGAVPPEGFEAWCELPDQLPERRRHGLALSWYDDGGLSRMTTSDHGRLDGPYVQWHRNGKPAVAGRYRADQRDGTWTVWFESGQREEQCGYERDVQHGPFATWWPDGKRRVLGQYCRGVQCGAWTTWDEAGRELGEMTFEEIRATP